MKGLGFWIIAVVGVIALFILLSTGMQDREKAFDERVSLREREKIPYGLYVMRKVLPSLFPEAKVYSSNESPSEWNKISPDSSGQLLIMPAANFNANSDELSALYSFVNNGNHVLILARTLSYETKSYFNLDDNNIFGEGYEDVNGLTATLSPPVFRKEEVFRYEGKRFSSFAEDFDTSRVITLGRNKDGDAQYIRLHSGRGTVHIHLAPLAFSNYFLLQGNNIRYLEQSMSVFPKDIHKIVWNEYTFYRRNPEEKEPSWLSVLFRFQSFRWAFLTALFLLILYTLLEMRRRQRMIPLIKKPKNDSLDFVETIGRLYYDRKDHKDLAMKMTTYFLDDVRTRFKLSTATIDESFTAALQAKSGYPADKLSNLIDLLNYIRMEPEVRESTLFRYHKQLEHFYQHS